MSRMRSGFRCEPATPRHRGAVPALGTCCIYLLGRGALMSSAMLAAGGPFIQQEGPDGLPQGGHRGRSNIVWLDVLLRVEA
jgi:hypothetical protein